MDEPNEVLSEKTGVADCTEASREASADHDRQAEGRTRRFPFRKARGAAFALAVCAVAAGLTFRIGIGTPSAFGIESIAAICPLGALETMFGARQIMLQPLLLLLGMVLVIALVGKAFCAWMCPAPWLKRLFKPGKRKAADGSVSAAHHACSHAREDGHRCAFARSRPWEEGATACAWTRAMPRCSARWELRPFSDSPCSASCAPLGSRLPPS